MSLSPEGRASLARFKKQLIDKLPDLIVRRVIEALHVIGQRISGLARRLAPRDEGELIASIGYDVDEARVSVRIFAGSKAVFWARWAEFGTVKMAAQPFFFPAYRSLVKWAQRQISAAVRKAKKATGYTS